MRDASDRRASETKFGSLTKKLGNHTTWCALGAPQRPLLPLPVRTRTRAQAIARVTTGSAGLAQTPHAAQLLLSKTTAPACAATAEKRIPRAWPTSTAVAACRGRTCVCKPRPRRRTSPPAPIPSTTVAPQALGAQTRDRRSIAHQSLAHTPKAGERPALYTTATETQVALAR